LTELYFKAPGMMPAIVIPLTEVRSGGSLYGKVAETAVNGRGRLKKLYIMAFPGCPDPFRRFIVPAAHYNKLFIRVSLRGKTLYRPLEKGALAG